MTKPNKRKTIPRALLQWSGGDVVPTVRQLNDLVSVGPATLDDLAVLGIRTIDELAQCEAGVLYDKLCRVTGARHDPCCEDVFAAAIAQARDPDLPTEQRQWWYWTKQRKARDQAPARAQRRTRPGRRSA